MPNETETTETTMSVSSLRMDSISASVMAILQFKARRQ
jgi:RNA-binding protein YlmH